MKVTIRRASGILVWLTKFQDPSFTLSPSSPEFFPFPSQDRDALTNTDNNHNLAAEDARIQEAIDQMQVLLGRLRDQRQQSQGDLAFSDDETIELLKETPYALMPLGCSLIGL